MTRLRSRRGRQARAGPKKENGSSAPATPAAGARPESAAGAGVVAVEDTNALHCGACFCNACHVVCSPCRDKLKATGKCHACGVATGGYSRCHVMERLVESIRIQCPNAAHGCTVRPAYYDKHNHSQTCVHAPCHCPSEACGFIGSMAALLDHCSGVHSWPCFKGKMTTTAALNASTSSTCTMVFNFLLADHTIDGQSSTSTASRQYLFLLNVARQPLGRAISVLCIHPHATTAGSGSHGPSWNEMIFELSYQGYVKSRPCNGDQVIEHYQKSRFGAACTDLSNGLPSPDSCYQFMVPDSVVADSDKDAIMVTVLIFIN
ncbi:hypothetical protein SETIT_3G035900v2 [Setaria italica]|uniref:SIAH-type domain-containing protein n=2 Tax=Setaria italica TaxID=4555 RepID=A0A368QBB5_SETIT|nr:hypothetical protein SETIT_3G035900v2 [Setaria italica]